MFAYGHGMAKAQAELRNVPQVAYLQQQWQQHQLQYHEGKCTARVAV
jgi:hypothetical protein